MMRTKRILALLVCLSLFMSMFGIAAATPIAPTNANNGVVFDIFDIPTIAWGRAPGGDGTIGNITNQNGAYTFHNVGGGWPNATVTFGEEIPFSPEDLHYIHFHFDIEVAYNASVHFIDIDFPQGARANWTIQAFGNGLTDVGDLLPGRYIGSASLANVIDYHFELEPNSSDGFDFVFGTFPFDDLLFSGLTIWAVGGDVTVREFRLIDTRIVDMRPLPTSEIDTPNSWAHTYMRDALQHGIVGAQLPSGVAFRQGAPRWYIAELLANFMVVYSNAANLDAVVANWLAVDGNVPGNINFPDVPATHPQYAQITALATMGVITGGTFDGVFGFGPNHTLTRAQAAVGLANMMRALGYDITNYDDASVFADWGIPVANGGIQSWAHMPVSFLYHYDVMGNTTSEINLLPDGSNYVFSPNMAFDTQQLITAMVRMLLEVEWPSPTLVSMLDFLDVPPSAWRALRVAGEAAQIDIVNGNLAVRNLVGGWPSRVLDLRDENISIPESDWDYISLIIDVDVTVANFNGYANIILSTDAGDREIVGEVTIAPISAPQLRAGNHRLTLPLRSILPNGTSGSIDIEGMLIQVVQAGTVVTVNQLMLHDSRDGYEFIAPEPQPDPEDEANFLVFDTATIVAGGSGTATVRGDGNGGRVTITNSGGGWPRATLTVANPVGIPRDEWHNYEFVYDFTASSSGEVSIALVSEVEANAPRHYASLTNYLRIMGAQRGGDDNDIVGSRYSGTVNLRTLLTSMQFDADVFYMYGLYVFAIGDGTVVRVDAAHVVPIEEEDVELFPADQVPVILYHMVLPCAIYEENGWQNNSVVLRLRHFYEQMRYLYEEGFTPITALQFEEWFFDNSVLLPKNPVLLHFDDGYMSDYMFAAPVLRQFGFVATNFRHTVTIYPQYQWNTGRYDLVGQGTNHMARRHMIRTKDVFEHASHSHDMHQGGWHLSNLYNQLGHAGLVSHLRNDFRTSINAAPMTLRHVFAYTYGVNNAAYHEALEAEGVTHAFDVTPQPARRTDNRWTISRYMIDSAGSRSNYPMWLFSAIANGTAAGNHG